MSSGDDGQVGEVTVVLSGDWSPLQTALAQANQALNQTGASFAVSGQAIDASLTTPLGRVAGATREATSSLPSFYEGVEEAGVRAGGAERAVRRLETSLGAVALQSLGASGGLAGAAARVGEASLLFGYGSQAVLGLGAGLAAFGLTLHLITAPLDEAKAANEQLNAALIKTAESVSPGMAAIENFSAIVQKFQETTDNLTRDQKLADFFRVFASLTGGLTSGIADALDAAAITERSNQATERTTGLILAGQVTKGQGADISHRGVADLGVLTAEGSVGAAPGGRGRVSIGGAAPDIGQSATQILSDDLQKIKDLNLSADVTDALDKPLVEAFDKTFIQAMKEAADKGDLGSLTALFERAKAGIEASGAPAGEVANAIDTLNKSFLELSKTLLQPVYQHELPVFHAPTAFRAFAGTSGLGTATPPIAPLQLSGAGGVPPLELPQVNLPQAQLTSAVGIQPKVTQSMVDEGQRLTEAVQLAPHDIQGEVTALETLAKTHQHLQELLTAGVISQGTFDKAMQAAEDQAAHTNKTMVELSGSLSSAFTQIGQAIGNSLAGAAGGLQNFGALLFKIFGSLLSTIGQSLIAFGTAGIAIKSFISNPFLAIAAGAALIALGTALGATATASVNSAGSAIASGGGFSGGAPTVYSATGGAMPQPQASTTVVINSRGGILNLNDPDTMDELQGALEQLTDTRVTLQIGRSS